VAKWGDDLWIAVKCQTNSEIAGSPRNILRYSPQQEVLGVEHWMDFQRAIFGIQSNSEYQATVSAESDREG